MRFLLLFGAGSVLMWLWVKRIPKPGEFVTEQWLKDHREAEGRDLEVEPLPALKLVKSEVASVPTAYSRPVGER